MVQLARRYRFSASHRLHSPQLSAAENVDVYGKCNNPYGHGHDYVLEVILRGSPDTRTGLLVPVQQLDEFVRRTVLADYDHKFLNEQIARFREIPPTTENVALDIRGRLLQAWPFGERPSLEGVRIFETRRNVVELK
jgi:6-pyruvoyltetrahydropterin/6-carboxytetrahydropterin synthase